MARVGLIKWPERISMTNPRRLFIAALALAASAAPPARAQADDELVAALSEVTNWKRQGDFVSFIGAKTLRFRLDTN